ncbi:MAG: hypoxanthine phosphoribosyltransferase [Epulopiscium sp.]|jgi:hypoxanthine phosphoribosyltransferase|nr:hypoxanthine phosphoribosyltransferase [Candidatus Epulonipiscium sp.]
MKNDVKEILFNEEEIAKKVKELAKKITEDYRGKDLTVIGILKGSNIFMGDLIRKIDIPLQIDFMVVSSYGQSTESSGIVRVIKDLDYSIEGKNILIVEDIIDTGLTLAYLKEILLKRKPQSVKICSLLDKPARRRVDLEVDYIGFETPDEFIVGYGIDYSEKYRNLPYIAVLKDEVYNK